MAIHDVDNSPNREAPMPNTHDTSFVTGSPIINQPKPAHGTTSINPVTDATSTAGHIITQNQAVVANDGTTNKALIGYQQGLGKWGLFVAKDGTDVTTNTDLSKFILNSSQDAFKITSSGSVTLNASLGTATATSTPHGADHVPAYLVFFKFPADTNTFQNTNWFDFISSTNFRGVQAWVDATDIHFQVQLGSGAGSSFAGNYVFNYYILQETAN